MSHIPVSYPLFIKLATGGNSTLTEDVDIYLTSENGSVTLPRAPTTKRKFYTIKNYSGGTVIIQPSGGDYIDWAANYSLASMNAVTIFPHPDGSPNWWIQSKYP